MTPFQEFRLWARRAPTGERISAAVATAVVATLLIWVLVPSGNTTGALPGMASTGQSGVAGAAPGQAPVGGSSGSVVGPGGGASAQGGAGPAARGAATSGATAGPVAAGGSRRTSGGAAASAACPASGAVGVTAKQIKVAVLLTQIAGAVANSSFGVAPVDKQKAYYQAAIDDLNASGGVACRKVVPDFYTANPTDKTDLQQKCFDIASAKVFAVFDTGAYALAPLMGCYAQHKIAYFGGYLIAESLRRQFYPYLFEFNTFDRIYHDTIFALKAKGFFDPKNGFKKLGFPYRSCYPDIIKMMKGWLGQAGVSSSQIVPYDVGCPDVLAKTSDIQQAVLTFQRAGVTHVTTAFFTGDYPQFTNVADQEQFHPKYGVPDDQLITTTYGATHANYHNFDGALAVVAARDGEETTPGMKPTPGTARCDRIFAKHGLDPTYKQPYAGGNACDEVWMFAAAVTHAQALVPTALAGGLQAAKSVEFAFPEGPNDFSGEGVTTGGQFWRIAQFHQSCSCWELVDRTFHPSIGF